MEEKNKLTYEQLEQVVINLQKKLMETREYINNIDVTRIRLEFLFKILNEKEHFTEEFCEKCAKEIMDTLTLDNPEENK